MFSSAAVSLDMKYLIWTPIKTSFKIGLKIWNGLASNFFRRRPDVKNHLNSWSFFFHLEINGEIFVIPLIPIILNYPTAWVFFSHMPTYEPFNPSLVRLLCLTRAFNNIYQLMTFLAWDLRSIVRPSFFFALILGTIKQIHSLLPLTDLAASLCNYSRMPPVLNMLAALKISTIGFSSFCLVFWK